MEDQTTDITIKIPAQAFKGWQRNSPVSVYVPSINDDVIRASGKSKTVAAEDATAQILAVLSAGFRKPAIVLDDDGASLWVFVQSGAETAGYRIADGRVTCSMGTDGTPEEAAERIVTNHTADNGAKRIL